MLASLFKRQRLSLFSQAWRCFSIDNQITKQQPPKNSIDTALMNVACAFYLPKEWSEEEIKNRLDPSGRALERVQILRNRLGDHSGKVIFTFLSSPAMNEFIAKYNEQYVKTHEGEGVQKIIVKPFNLVPTVAPTENGQRGVRVSNIPFDLTKVEVNKLAQDFGEVVDIKMPLRPDGNNHGYAVVFFEKEQSRQEFCAFINERMFLGRKLRAQLYKPPKAHISNADKEQELSKPPRVVMQQNKRLVRQQLSKQSVPADQQ